MDQPVERSPPTSCACSSRAAAILIVLAVEWLFGDALVAFMSDVLRGIDAVPTWIVDVVVVGTRILGACVVGGVLWWVLRGRRWQMLVTVAAAGLLAAALVTVLDALIETDPGRVLVDVGADAVRSPTRASHPHTGMAAVVGVLTAAAPRWLRRRWRRAGWALIVGLMATGFVDSPVSFDLILAPAVGWFSGAAVLVAAGAPTRNHRRRPSSTDCATLDCPCGDSSRPASTPVDQLLPRCRLRRFQVVRQGARRR